MASHNQTGRSTRTLKNFIALEKYMLASPAWTSLSPNARCAFIELLSKYNGRNNGRIGLSGRSLAEHLHISRATAARALNELTDRGFIEVARKCGFNQKSGVGRATEWRVTLYVCDTTGARPSKKFMHWHAGKFHLTASSQSHHGLTREPPALTTQ